MDLKQLRIKRKGLRNSFTACANKIDKELANEAPDYKQLLVLKNQFKDKFDRLSVCQEDISQGILETEEEKKNFDTDLEEAEVYRDKFCSIVTSIDTFGFEIASVKEEKRKFKLPKIELKRFSGDAKEYLSFWSQFEKIHLDNSLPAEDKFQYLIQSVVPGSKAARLVESFPATAANYDKAIQQLRERFGREDLLVQIYVRELLSMVMKNAVSGRSKADLPALYDELEGKLRALESLGRTQEKYGDFLTPLVESCLPEDILIAWERSRNKGDSSSTDDRNLKNLMLFIKQEVIGEEMVVLARTGFGANGVKKKSQFACDSTQEIHTAAALVSTSQDSAGRTNFFCLFCSKKHLSQDCFMARKLSYEDKRKVIAKKGACFCCLKPGHLARQCRFKTRCIHCNRNHFILMCPERETSSNENKNEVAKNVLVKNDLASTSALTNSDKSATVFLMTLIVKIKNRNYEKKVRALVDTGSQLSYLSKRIINDLKLKPKRKCDLVHNLFGGTKSEPKSHEMYEIEIFNLEDTFSIKVDVLSENKICGFVPKLTDMVVINELNSKNILLPDLNSTECEIDLLLGADISGLIMTEKSLKLS